MHLEQDTDQSTILQKPKLAGDEQNIEEIADNEDKHPNSVEVEP